MRNQILLIPLTVGLLFFRAGFMAPAASTINLTLTVNRVQDGDDLNPGDGICDASVNVGEQCTLRAAIEELNMHPSPPSPHRIEFNISGTGPFTISPLTQLPYIGVPVEIDGETQPGATCPTQSAPADLKIILDGSSAPTPPSGLYLLQGSDGSTIRGLVIGNFLIGVVIDSSYNALVCNHIGLGVNGVSAMGNDRGVLITGLYNRVGGVNFPNERNVISANKSIGIYVEKFTTSNSIAQNFIGTTADGMSAAGNQTGGVFIAGGDNFVFGLPTTDSQNLISGNGGYGIRIDEGYDNVIQHNFIGIARDGVTSLPNGGNGIEIVGAATNNEIGGVFRLLAAEKIPIFSAGNLIANNGGHGVALLKAGGVNPASNPIVMNSIYDNMGLGIDLGNDGVDVNDPGDVDGGANGGQNHPVLTQITDSPFVTVTLDGQSSTTYDIELYRGPACDPSGYGEGKGYLKAIQMTTDGSGYAAFDVDMIGLASPGDSITATAVDPLANTSEFSNCVILTSPATEMIFFVPIIIR